MTDAWIHTGQFVIVLSLATVAWLVFATALLVAAVERLCK